MTTDSLTPTRYFTENVPAKAVIATAGVAWSSLYERLCQTSLVSGEVCALANGVPVLLKLLLFMQALDLISGVLAARSTGERINSRRLSIGMKRKMLMLLVVTGSVVIDSVFREHGFSTDGLLFRWAASWFIAVESLSLYENADRMGVPVPPFLRQAVEWLLQKARQGGGAVLPPEATVAPKPTTFQDPSAHD